METVKIKHNGKEEELVVKLEDFEKDDDLFLLSKEIEDTKFEDTIDLSSYFDKTMEIKLNESNGN